jgi:hypothetical protein
MPIAKKNTTTGDIVLVKKMRDCSNDPFVKRKTEKVIAILEKYGMPKWHAKNTR